MIPDAKIIIAIGAVVLIVVVLVVLFYRWSKIPKGCDHTFPKNNELNPPCEKCGRRLMAIIENDLKK